MFKRKLVHSAEVAIVTQNNFVTMLKIFITNVLKCKTHLKTKLKCAFATMYAFLSNEFLFT